MTQAVQQIFDLTAGNAAPNAQQSSLAFPDGETLGETVEHALKIEAVKAFELAIEILGATASTAEEIVASGARSICEMELHGDRIDRLHAENWRSINEFLLV